MATTAQAAAHFRATAPKYMRRLALAFPVLDELDLAAIFGNAGHESKGLTDDQEDAPTVKGSRGGANWFQWTGPRRRQLEAFAKARSLDPMGDEAAYQFLVHELQTSEAKAIPALLAAKGLDAKVKAFEKAFERAGVKHYPSRLAWAQKALEAYRGRVTPEAPETPVSGFPRLGDRNSEQVALIQRRLKELGYVEIGNVDGDFGDLTAKAILAFRHDNGLPLGTTVDSSLIVALNKAQPRQMPEARSEATAKEVREKVPEAKESWFSKVAALWGMVFSAVAAVVQFVAANFTAARDMVKPIADAFGAIPTWAWAGLIAAGLLVIYLKSRASEANTVAAYQEGARR